MHRGERGRLSLLALGGPLWEGLCSTGREAGLLEGWIHRSTELSVCVVQASLVNWFPLGFWLGDGEGDGAGKHL